MFIRPNSPLTTTRPGFTLAQNVGIGKACGLPGVKPGTSCEPLIATVGSQDTTGSDDPRRDEATGHEQGFSSDLVMQSFGHTAAYPKPVDLQTQQDLPRILC